MYMAHDLKVSLNNVFSMNNKINCLLLVKTNLCLYITVTQKIGWPYFKTTAFINTTFQKGSVTFSCHYISHEQACNWAVITFRFMCGQQGRACE